jgi:flagellar biogenesis protein FliO
MVKQPTHNRMLVWMALTALGGLWCGVAPAGAAAAATQPASASDPLRALAETILAAPPADRAAAATQPAATGQPMTPTRPAAAAAAAPVLPAIELQKLGATANDGASRKGPAGEGTSSTPWWLTTGAALAVVLALIFVLRGVLARWAGRSAAGINSPVVEVLHRTALAPRQHLVLIRLGARVLLVNESASGLRTLATIRDPQEVADLLANLSAGKPSSASSGFHDLMRRVIGSQGEQEALAQEGDDREGQVDSARDELSGLASRLRAMGAQEPKR